MPVQDPPPSIAARVYQHTTPNNRGFTVAAPGVLRDLQGAVVNLPPKAFTRWTVPVPVIAAELACDPTNGDILVAVKGEGVTPVLPEFPDWPGILRLTREGEWSFVREYKHLEEPAGLAVSAAGDIFVSYASGLATRPLKTGVWQAAPGFPAGAAYSTSKVVIDNQGKVLVLRTTDIVEYDPVSRATKTISGPGAAELRAMAMDSAGVLYVADTALWKRDLSGAWSQVPYTGQPPWWITPDDQGRLWVGSAEGYRLRDAQGAWTLNATGQVEPVRNVGGSCCDLNGDVWIGRYGATDQDNNYLQQLTSFTKTSKGRVFWRSDGSFTYMPDSGAVGEDTFTAPVSLGNGGADAGVSIRVLLTQTQVVATNTRVGAVSGQPRYIVFLARTFASSYSLCGWPQNQSGDIDVFATNQARWVRYTPFANFVGTDIVNFDAAIYTLGVVWAPKSTGTFTVQVGSGRATEWSTTINQGLAVGPPGVLNAGETALPPAPSWARYRDLLLSPQCVGFNPTTKEVWIVGKTDAGWVVLCLSPEQVRCEIPGTFFTPNLSAPAGITVDAQGRVWLTDSGTKVIHHLDHRFRWSTIPTTDAPAAVALNSAGVLHVSFPEAGEVRSYSATDGWTVVAGKGDSQGALTSPRGIGFGSKDELVVADEGANTVRSLYQGVWATLSSPATDGNPAGTFSAPMGLRVGGDDRVWVADHKNRRIQVYSPIGAVWTILPDRGGENPDLLGPIDLTLDEYGNVWAADKAEGVQHFAPFQVTERGAFELRPDGSFLYRAGSLTGYDQATLNISGPKGKSTALISVVIKEP